MAHHPKFEEFRWIGDKRDRRVYDTDDDAQLAAVIDAPLEKLQAFAPDELFEARNRGFKPAVKVRSAEDEPEPVE